MTATAPTLTKPHLTHLTSKTLAVVQRLDRDHSYPAWDDEKWTEHRALADFVTITAERDGQIVGFISYRRRPERYEIVKLVVSEPHRRTRIGTQLVDWIKQCATTVNQPEIRADVWDAAYPAQKLFAACGFKAASIQKEHFKHSGEDAYRMVFDLVELRRQIA